MKIKTISLKERTSDVYAVLVFFFDANHGSSAPREEAVSDAVAGSLVVVGVSDDSTEVPAGASSKA